MLVSQYTILAGEVTGVLDRERSPYMVVEDVVVPAGDSLRIEPGVEIRFQWEPVEDLRHRIVVRGELNAVGTPEDSIYFLPEYGDSLLNAWRGIWCLNPVDTTFVIYTEFLNSGYGICADSGGIAQAIHCWFHNPYYKGVRVFRESWTGIDSCNFINLNPAGGPYLYVDSASASVTNSCFEYPETAEEHNSSFIFTNDATGLVSGCTFSIGRGGSFDMHSRGEFLRNRTRFTTNGIWYMNGSSGVFANNIVVDGNLGMEVASYMPLADTILISNNVFYNLDVGIIWSNPAHEGHVKNNVFLANREGIRDFDAIIPFANIGYNDFFANDSDFVNCIPDSTNIYLNPIVQDTINFRLSLGSPCIDAGDPDPFFNDVDSTRNDIGCWGGPWGESYPYVPVLSHILKYIPSEFALLPPYPNPFNSVLIIPFTIPIEKEVMITIYNILGQKVQEYSFPPLSPGVHRVVWNSGSCASGLYIVRLITGDKEFVQKALLLR